MTIAIAPEPVPVETDADGAVRVGGTRVTLDTLVAASTPATRPRRSTSSTRLLISLTSTPC